METILNLNCSVPLHICFRRNLTALLIHVSPTAECFEIKDFLDLKEKKF